MPRLAIDSRQDVRLLNGGYIRRELPCGGHRLALLAEASFDPIDIDISLEKGRTAYVRYRVDKVETSGGVALLFVNPMLAVPLLAGTGPGWAYALDEVAEPVAVAELKGTRSIEEGQE